MSTLFAKTLVYSNQNHPKKTAHKIAKQLLKESQDHP